MLGKSDGRVPSKELLVVMPGNPFTGLGPDTRHPMRIASGLKNQFKVRVAFLDSDMWNWRTFGNMRYVTSDFRLLLRGLFGNQLRLYRTLRFETGYVYLVRLPLIISGLFFQKAFRLRFRIIAGVLGTPQFHDARLRFLFKVGLAFILRQVDAIAYDPNSSVGKLIRGVGKPTLTVPSVALDIHNIPETTSGVEIRRKLGIGKQPLIGVVGPFNRGSRAEIRYVMNHISSLTESAMVMLIGEYDSRDKFAHPRVIFTGFVEDYWAYLDCLDCLLIPRLAKSGNPMNKMVEAMYLGKPVVTNEFEWLPIVDGEHAILGELDNLPRYVNNLMSDEGLRQRIGQNARRYVEQNCTLDQVLASFIGFLGA